MNDLLHIETNGLFGAVIVSLYKIELLKYLSKRKLLTKDIEKYINDLKLTSFAVMNDFRSFDEVYLSILRDLELKKHLNKSKSF